MAIIDIAKPEAAQKALKQSKKAFQLGPDLNKLIKDFGQVAGGKLFLEQGGSQQALNQFINSQKSSATGSVSIPGASYATGSVQINGNAPNGSSADGFPSIEDRIAAQMAQEQQEKFEAGQELFGEESPILPSSLDLKITESVQKRKADELIRKQREDLAFLNTQQGRQDILESGQVQKTQKDLEAATGAVTAATMPGRKGPVSVGNIQLSKQFSAEANRQIQEAGIRLQMAQDSRARIKRDMLEAQKQGKVTLVEQYQKQLINAEQQIRNADTALLDAENKANQVAADIAFKNAQINASAFDALDKMPAGSLADLTISDIMNSFSVDAITAASMKSIDAKQAELRLDDPDYLKKKAEIDKMRAEVKTAGMTNEQKNFMFANTIDDPVERQQFLNFAGLNPDFTPVKIEDKLFAFNEQTGKAMMIAGNADPQKLGLKPTGILTSATIAGRNITLDSGAMASLKLANAEFVEATGGQIKIGDPRYSSTRKQEDVIRYMADNHGVPYNEKNPNETAQTLRSMGHAVADVGNSAHEYGMALDIFPDSVYIDQVKPYLEGRGWVQPYPLKDPGHFEFRGTRVYTDAERQFMSDLDVSKPLTSSALESISKMGLTVDDVFAFKANEKKQLPEDKKEQIRQIIKGIEGLQSDSLDENRAASGFDTAVGSSLQKSFGALPGIKNWGAEEGFIAGSDAEGFKSRFDLFRDNLTLPSLEKLKGAMSDKDIQFLRNSVTALSLNMSEKDFKAELIRLKNKFEEILNYGSLPIEQLPDRNVIPYTIPEENELINRY